MLSFVLARFSLFFHFPLLSPKKSFLLQLSPPISIRYLTRSSTSNVSSHLNHHEPSTAIPSFNLRTHEYDKERQDFQSAPPTPFPAMEDSGLRAGYGGLTVSVRLISPAQDLADFPDLADLPVSTTVGQIKLLIGNELAFRNRSPAGMRVIFRGRLLDMDEKTLAEVFGIPTVRHLSFPPPFWSLHSFLCLAEWH